MKLQEVEYSIGKVKLAGLVNRSFKKPTLLCLHGWLDNAASFIPLMNHMNKHDMIAIDWPGHGYSSHRSSDAHYHFIDYVYDLLLLFDNNQWDHVNIVAHSMGGMIASAFAAAFPERIRTLNLIDSIGFISADEQQSTKQLRVGMLSRLKCQSKRKTYHKSIDAAIQARMQVSDLNYDNAKLIIERGLESKTKGFTWRADPRLRNVSPYRLSFKQAIQYIKDIKTPTQLIYGKDGIELIEKGLKHYAPLFKTFLSHELEGGHHLHMENVGLVAMHIEDFIKSVDEK